MQLQQENSSNWREENPSNCVREYKKLIQAELSNMESDLNRPYLQAINQVLETKYKIMKTNRIKSPIKTVQRPSNTEHPSTDFVMNSVDLKKQLRGGKRGRFKNGEKTKRTSPSKLKSRTVFGTQQKNSMQHLNDRSSIQVNDYGSLPSVVQPMESHTSLI